MNRVMIVDDEIKSLDLLQKYMDTYMPDFCVSGIYSNGRDALNAFLKDPADIAVIDIEMPVMDGLTLIEELNKYSDDYIPIILSSYEIFAYAKSAMKNGVEHYLSKPFDFDEVCHALETAAKKLQFKRLLQSDLIFNDEREDYFADLLAGQFPTSAKALQQFSELNFPFHYADCRGCFFEISLKQVGRWTFGKETLFTAIRNLLHMVYSPCYLVLVSAKRNLCSFVMVTQEYPDGDLPEVIRHGRDLLQMDMTVKSFLQFSSVEQLRTVGTNQTGIQNNAFNMDDYMSHKGDISKAIEYIRDHYSEDLTRSAMARMFYMSDAYFSRCFKVITQKTFKSFLTEVRMEKAIELLSRDVKIQDIARAVGYETPTRFTIVFRQYTSYTPTEYRSVVLKRF